MKKKRTKKQARSPRRKRLVLAADGSDARRVFILGAGFSYAADFPLAKHLLPRIYERLAEGDRSTLLTSFRYLYPFEPITPVDQILATVQVEDFMSLLDVTELMNRQLPDTFFKPRVIVDLRRKLLTAMADLMLQNQDRAEEERKVAYVDRFVVRLGPNDTVLTFNWDLLLERRLLMQNIEYAYEAAAGVRPRLTVLKLHGSVDWFHGSELDNLEEAEPIHRQLFKMPYHRLIQPDAPWRGAATPYVVPPTFFKSVNGIEDLERIWGLAFERLVEADEIHLCGYRLPREDMYARAVLRRAIRTNVLRRSQDGRPPPIVTVVNPTPEVADEMKAILHHELVPELEVFQNSRWAQEPKL